MIDWRVKGREFVNCNCDYGCPCQFTALPTHGSCEAIVNVQIDEGHFDEVNLDGLRCTGVYQWPGAVHEGDGTMQLIVDERADEAQRAALLSIMNGNETEPLATMWAVYAAMCTTAHEPLVKPIDFEIDIEARTARVAIPGAVEGSGEPLRNRRTGLPHTARIDIPEGFEFAVAEVGSGTSRTMGGVKLDLEKSYGQFAHLHLTGAGPVR
jgi:hypothetical protein